MSRHARPTYGCCMGILAEPWPGDLDPSRVPFRQRTITVLKGMRLWDDMTRIDELTVDDVAGYWVTGPVTVNDLITSGNEAIEWHHNQPARLEQVTTDDWTRQVWRRDLRFRDLLPEVDATVHDIAISGHHIHQRYLLKTLPKLRMRLDVFARARLGHSSIRTTLDTYGHLFEGLDEAAADRLDASYQEALADSPRTVARS